MDFCQGRGKEADICKYSEKCDEKFDCTTSVDINSGKYPVYIAGFGECKRDDGGINMSKKDIEWLEKCKAEPERYKIYVDNDCVSVTDLEQDEDIYAFRTYGYEFALELLQYMGCNANMI